jgi:alpha-tubulin suppressor-like RCC1 family protein
MFIIKVFIIILISILLSIFTVSCDSSQQSNLSEIKTYKLGYLVTGNNILYKNDNGFKKAYDTPAKKFDSSSVLLEDGMFYIPSKNIAVKDVEDYESYKYRAFEGYATVNILKMKDGTAKSFGENDYGVLGIGQGSSDEAKCSERNICYFSREDVPTIIVGLSDIKSISVLKYAVSGAVTNNGTVYAWGANHNGQLPIGKTFSDYGCSDWGECRRAYETTPVEVAQISNIKKITSFTSDGVYYISDDDKLKFYNVSLETSETKIDSFKKLINSEGYIFFLKENGELLNNYGNTLLSNIKDFEFYRTSLIAITNNNKLKIYDDFFQEQSSYENIDSFVDVNRGGITTKSNVLYKNIDGNLVDISSNTIIEGLQNYKKIIFYGFTGEYSSSVSYFVLMNDGSIKAWGENIKGLFKIEDDRIEQPITLDYLNKADDIACTYGSSFGLFLVNIGNDVKAIGSNSYDQLGLGKIPEDYGCMEDAGCTMWEDTLQSVIIK